MMEFATAWTEIYTKKFMKWIGLFFLPFLSFFFLFCSLFSFHLFLFFFSFLLFPFSFFLFSFSFSFSFLSLPLSQTPPSKIEQHFHRKDAYTALSTKISGNFDYVESVYGSDQLTPNVTTANPTLITNNNISTRKSPVMFEMDDEEDEEDEEGSLMAGGEARELEGTLDEILIIPHQRPPPFQNHH